MTSEAANLLSALDTFYEVSQVLRRDVKRCGDSFGALKEGHPNPTPEQREEGQFWLRAFTRSFFALVEGVAYTFRQSALFLYKSGQLQLSEGEYALLAEKRYQWDMGKIREVDNFNRALDNVQIAFALFPRAFGVNFVLNVGDHRYNSFQQALKFRDTITHPKAPSDLALTGEVMNHLGNAVGWFSSEALRMQRLCYDTIDPAVWAEWVQLRGGTPSEVENDK
jgi:hypothetical protein